MKLESTIPNELETARATRAKALTELTEATEAARAAQAIADRETAAAAEARRVADDADLDDAAALEATFRDAEARAKCANAIATAAHDLVAQRRTRLEAATAQTHEQAIRSLISDAEKDMARVVELESEALALREKWVSFDVASGRLRLPKPVHLVLGQQIASPGRWYHEIAGNRRVQEQIETWKARITAMVESE